MGLGAPVLLHLVVDAIGGATQGQLAQGDQIALAEEVLHRAFSLLRHVDLAILEALQQFVRRQVDQHHFVGHIENAVGHRLTDGHTGDATDDVVEGFKVLDVDRGPYVDTRSEQFFDVLPALGMTRPGGVAVGQFIDDSDGRRTLQRGIKVELLEHSTLIVDLAQGDAVYAICHDLGFQAAMGFDDRR